MRFRWALWGVVALLIGCDSCGACDGVGSPKQRFGKIEVIYKDGAQPWPDLEAYLMEFQRLEPDASKKLIIYLYPPQHSLGEHPDPTKEIFCKYETMWNNVHIRQVDKSAAVSCLAHELAHHLDWHYGFGSLFSPHSEAWKMACLDLSRKMRRKFPEQVDLCGGVAQ